MEPIMKSLLDVDFYKFTMGLLVFLKYRYVKVRYALTNRTRRVPLAADGFVSEAELRRELDHARTLKFGKSELHYLRGTNEYQERMFPEAYLEFLSELKLPEYRLASENGQFVLEFEGNWAEAIYWETIALSILNELYCRSVIRPLSRFEREVAYAEGRRRLMDKIQKLREYPGLTFCDFGTRRRWSREWQEYVVGVMAEEMPGQFLGTSNVQLAMQYGLLPMGTSAHEMYMVMSGIAGDDDAAILASHNRVLQDWWSVYGHGLSIALTDTYGTDFFFRDMTAEQAARWKGLRQDSGDPFVFGEKAIRFYESHGLDPKDKLIVFSDGLDVPTMIGLYERFDGRIKVTFGWGTNLTNDLGPAALSLVVKTVSANGTPLVKLSDNLAKAIGEPRRVERLKKIFSYAGNFSEEPRY